MKALRLEQKLTLEEVGNRVGVGKSTVRKWENGQIANMRRDKIALVAKALNTTPGFLMGWDDNEIKAAQAPVEDPERQRISTLFQSLTEENQQKLLDYAQMLLKVQQAERGSQE